MSNINRALLNGKTAWLVVAMTLAFCLFVVAETVSASVVMTGTRVIYPAEQKERTLQFSNKSNTPFVVQLWVDEKAQGSIQEESKSPFVVTPPVFRINGGDGQVARMMVVDPSQLPQDRESVYYLNFSQIPGIQENQLEGNQLMIMVVNRLKVFYRPLGLEPPTQNMGDALEFSLNGQDLTVKNPTPYHASVSSANVDFKGKSYPIDKVDMVAPFSSVVWKLPKEVSGSNGVKTLKIGVVSDFGTVVRSEHKLP